MYIKEIGIISFGPISKRRFTFDESLNIIEGHNESGKTTLAGFIKFIFYGLSSRQSGDQNLSERQKYVNWTNDLAEGYLILADTEEKKEYRIDRRLSAQSTAEGKTKYSEFLSVTDNSTKEKINTGPAPGEYFFGLSEKLFVNTSFSPQEKTVRTNSSDLKESIGNMISSADESIDVKKALSSLDSARASLMHKDKKGGEIVSLREKTAELNSSLEESQALNEDYLKVSGELNDVKLHIEKAEKRKNEISDLSDAFKAAEFLRRKERIDKNVSELKKIETVLKESKLSSVDDSFKGDLAVALSKIKRYDEVKKVFEAKFGDQGAPTSPDDLREALESVRKAEKSYGVLRSVAVVFLIIALITLASTVAIFFIKGFLMIPFAVTIMASLIVSLLFFILSRKKENCSYQILDSYDCETADDFEELIMGEQKKCEIYASSEKSLDMAKEELLSAAEMLSSLAEKLGVKYESTEEKNIKKLAAELCKVTKTASEKKKSFEDEASKLKGIISEGKYYITAEAEEKSEQAKDILSSEIGKASLSIDPEERKKIENEMKFVQTKLAGLKEKELILERRLATLEALRADPSYLSEQIDELKEETASKEKKLAAYELAYEHLSKASSSLRASLVPEMNKSICSFMDKATDGKYEDLGITNDFLIHFSSDDSGDRDIEFLSSGTKDLAYIALRLALVRYLCTQKRFPPVIFDESFAFLDIDRLKKVMKTIKYDNSDLQTLLFTCRPTESEALPEANHIRL